MRIDLLLLKYCFTQFFPDSTKRVSNATVHNSDEIETLMYSNDVNGFF